jgi:hypothetical protein
MGANFTFTREKQCDCWSWLCTAMHLPAPPAMLEVMKYGALHSN